MIERGEGHRRVRTVPFASLLKRPNEKPAHGGESAAQHPAARASAPGAGAWTETVPFSNFYIEIRNAFKMFHF